jgi:hypothetical protein
VNAKIAPASSPASALPVSSRAKRNIPVPASTNVASSATL